jgi:pimeloyl-ACP methyl ester carboxylesterase
VRIITRGSGAPLVLIPRLEGRWQYLEAVIDELARSFRVVTFSLCGEPDSGCPLDRTRGLANYVDQVERALDAERIERATVCGVSFGGVIAARFAAAHPGRTSALVLASPPGPAFQLKPRHLLYARWPRVFGALFVAETPWRLRKEMAAAFPGAGARAQFAMAQLRTIARAPLSLPRMAERARLIASLDLRPDCARITCPTFIITGEPGLDFIVPVEGSSDYLRWIPGASAAVLEQTGHQGVMTRPAGFAALVREFVEGHRDAAA